MSGIVKCNYYLDVFREKMASIERFVLSVRDVETRIGVTMNADLSLYIS
jgi:hypothetical protein